MHSTVINRRGFLAGSLGASALLALSACGSGNAGGNASAITWSTWGTPEEGQRFKKFNDQFKADHADIRATLQMVPSYSDYHSKLLTQLTSGTAPDVFYVGDDFMGKFVDSGVLMNLDPVVNGSGSLQVADFNDSLFGAAKTGEGLFALPNDCNPDVLWFDKKALAAAGINENPAELAASGQWTVDAFLDMCAKLADAGLHGALFWNYWATHWSWVVANGGTVFDAQDNFVLPDDEVSVQALESLGKAFQQKHFTVADSLPEGSGGDSLFATHKAGFYVQGRYGIATAEQSGNRDDYDIAPWPSISGKPGPSGVATSYLAINNKTKSGEAASTFLAEFLNADGQTLRLADGGNAVPSIKGADDVVLRDSYPEHAQTFLDLRDTGFSNFAREAKVPGLSAEISTAMLALYEGKATTAETVSAVTTLVTKGA